MDFANLHYYFILGFNKITATFIFMVKIADIKVTFFKILKTNNKIGSGSIEVGNMNVKKSKKFSKSKNLFNFKKSDFIKVNFSKTDFFTSKAQKTFANL